MEGHVVKGHVVKGQMQELLNMTEGRTTLAHGYGSRLYKLAKSCFFRNGAAPFRQTACASRWLPDHERASAFAEGATPASAA
jgi:hypothetical protein